MMDYGMNRLRRLGGVNMLGDQAVNATPSLEQSRPGYWWNDQRVDPSRPFNERFAGGQLGAQFVPYQGDPLRYGMGPQHRYNQVDPTRFGTNTATGTATPAAVQDHGNYQQQQGGPDAGEQSDVRGHGRDQAPFDAEKFSLDLSKLGDMIAGLSFGAMALGKGGMTKEQFGPPQDVGVSVAEMGQGATGDGFNGGQDNQDHSADSTGGGLGGDRGISGGNVEGDPQGLAEGGIVEGDSERGVDDVTINADGGEGVIRAEPMMQLGKPFLDALNKGEFAVAYDILGHILGKTEEQEEVEEAEGPDMDDRGRMEEEIARRGEVTRAASPSRPQAA